MADPRTHCQDLTDAQKKVEAEHTKSCITEVGVTAEAIKKLSEGDYTSKDEKIKCFTKCVLHKAGLINDKGVLQEKEAIEKLSQGADKAKITELVGKCKVSGSDACDNAYKMHECFKKAKAV